MLAAKAASALPYWMASARCSGLPAPPLATTGIETASLTARVISRSYPFLVPSASMQVSTISPAPSRSTSRAQATASKPVPTPPAVDVHLPNFRPSFCTRLGSIFTTIHWLPKRRAAWRTNSGSRGAAELIDTLSQPAQSNCANIVERADSAPDAQRHENHLGRPAHDVEHDGAPLVAGGDVQKDELVGPFLLVAGGHVDRVAGIAQLTKLRAFDDPAPIDVKAGNHPLGKHLAPFLLFRSRGAVFRDVWPPNSHFTPP